MTSGSKDSDVDIEFVRVVDYACYGLVYRYVSKEMATSPSGNNIRKSMEEHSCHAEDLAQRRSLEQSDARMRAHKSAANARTQVCARYAQKSVDTAGICDSSMR